MLKDCEKGISKQAFALIPKIREVNEVVRRRDPQQTRIIEIHPEVCFWALNGKRAMSFPKREDEGYRERRRLLDSWLSEPLWESPKIAAKQALGAAADDVLDSIAAAWTGERWANPNKSVGRFPAIEQKDDKGLRAEIVY
jgi:predicted RNase H-like nuclease